MRADTDPKRWSVSEVDVIVDLGVSLGPLIDGDRLDYVKRDRKLEGLEEGERIVTGQLFEYAQKLAELTEWPEAKLLEQIGCTIRSEEELQTLPKQRLDNCERFLKLLCDSAEVVSTTRNRRTVTRTCAELIRQTKQDAAGLERLCHSGDPSPFEYMKLGEIAQAARVARLEAGEGRPEDLRPPGPYAALERVHISTPRLDAHLQEEREVLGERVFESISAHLTTCDACRRAAETRREQLQAA